MEEPAIDLPLALSLGSSYMDKPVPSDLTIFGEIGLAGEARGVGQPETRLKEAAKMGFKRALMPKNNVDKLKNIKNIDLIGVNSIKEAFDVLF